MEIDSKIEPMAKQEEMFTFSFTKRKVSKGQVSDENIAPLSANKVSRYWYGGIFLIVSLMIIAGAVSVYFTTKPSNKSNIAAYNVPTIQPTTSLQYSTSFQAIQELKGVDTATFLSSAELSTVFLNAVSTSIDVPIEDIAITAVDEISSTASAFKASFNAKGISISYNITLYGYSDAEILDQYNLISGLLETSVTNDQFTTTLIQLLSDNSFSYPIVSANTVSISQPRANIGIFNFIPTSAPNSIGTAAPTVPFNTKSTINPSLYEYISTHPFTLPPYTVFPTRKPVARPTLKPSSVKPTPAPSRPTAKPSSRSPSTKPTTEPTGIYEAPFVNCTGLPTFLPTVRPTSSPTIKSSLRPTVAKGLPTSRPSINPTMSPTNLNGYGYSYYPAGTGWVSLPLVYYLQTPYNLPVCAR